MQLPPKFKNIVYPPYLISRIMNIAESSGTKSYKDLYLSIENLFEEAFSELKYEDIEKCFSIQNSFNEIQELSIEDLSLYQKLSDLRYEIAKSKNIAPFYVFDNKTLRYLSFHKPTNKEEMIQIHGIKERKYQQYGELFLNVIKEFIASLQLNIQKEITTLYLNDIPKKSDSWTSQEELELKSLFIKGKNIDEISHALNKNPGCVKARLIKLGLWER